jgi:hypothetical protein
LRRTRKKPRASHAGRMVDFGEWLCTNVLKKIPHRHFVFSIPKILRRYFLYDRRLLHDLCRCAWESLKVFNLHQDRNIGDAFAEILLHVGFGLGPFHPQLDIK